MLLGGTSLVTLQGAVCPPLSWLESKAKKQEAAVCSPKRDYILKWVELVYMC
jgi:hypothetical protein